MTDHFRKRVHELNRMPLSELQSRLSEANNSITRKDPENRWCQPSYEMPKGVARYRRMLKSALEEARKREECVQEAQKRGNEKASNRPECVKTAKDPYLASDGDVVAYFVETNFVIKRGNYRKGNFVIEVKNQGIASAEYYEEAVRKVYRIMEGQQRDR
jgi:hypothetical protein